MKKGTWLTLSHLLLVPWLIGCSGLGAFAQDPGIRDPEYSFCFYNASDQRLDEVGITWNSGGIACQASAGILVPDLDHGGSGKGDAFQPDPIPAKVLLRWRTPDGQRHQREMEVASQVRDPKRFSGSIFFKYVRRGDEEDWYVVPMSHAQTDALAERQKSIIPPDSPPAFTQPATRPAAAATAPAAEEQVKDAAKMVHLILFRPPLARLGDYCFSEDPATQRLVDACTHEATAGHQLAAAVREKLGDAALIPLNLDLPDAQVVLQKGWAEMKRAGDPFPAELEKAAVHVNGDHAAIHLKGVAWSARRIGGHWKLQVPAWNQIAAAFGNLPGSDAATMTRASEAVSAVDEQVTAEVRNGKLHSADEVARAKEKRLDVLRDKTQPTTYPVASEERVTIPTR